jgi:hypothetical protein
LCGEAQIITEPYRPNPCETCGDIRREVPDSPDASRNPELSYGIENR